MDDEQEFFTWADEEIAAKRVTEKEMEDLYVSMKESGDFDSEPEAADNPLMAEEPMDTSNRSGRNMRDDLMAAGEWVGEQAVDRLETSAGLVENVANMATSMVAKPVSEAYGLRSMVRDATGLADEDPSQVKADVQDMMTYNVKTERGQEIAESPYNPVNIIAKGIDTVANYTSSFFRDEEAPAYTPLNMMANAVHEATIQAPALIGAKYGTKKARSNAQLKKTNQLLKDMDKDLRIAAREEAQSKGFITPAEKGAKAQIAGVAKTDRAISSTNQVRATELAKKEIGAPEGLGLSNEVFQTLKEAHYSSYERVVSALERTYPTLRIAATKEFVKTMQNHLTEATKRFSEYRRGNKHLKEAMALFKEQVNKPHHSPREVMNAIRSFREEAKRIYTHAGSKQKAIDSAAAKMAIADGLEGLLESHLKAAGMNDLMLAFRTSRKKLSQIHIVENATNPVTGEITIKTIADMHARMMQKSGRSPMTGELRTIADFGTAFPKGAIPMKGAPQYIGLFDTVVAGVSLAAGHPGWATLEMLGRLGLPQLAKKGVFQTTAKKYRATNRTASATKDIGAVLPSQAEKSRNRTKARSKDNF